MEGLPRSQEYFGDFLGPLNMQIPSAVTTTRSLPPSQSAPSCTSSDSFPRRNLVRLPQCNACSNSMSSGMYTLHSHGNEDARYKNRHKVSSTYYSLARDNRLEASSIGQTNQGVSSKSSEGSMNSSRHFSDNTGPIGDTEITHTDNRVHVDGLKAMLSSPASDIDCWFNFNSPIAQRVERAVSHLSRDGLYAEYWKATPNRLLYGSQQSRTKKHTIQGIKSRHGAREAARRARHLHLQRSSHSMTNNISRSLSDDDIYRPLWALGGERVRCTQGIGEASIKLPSKDDQLCSSLYMHVVSAFAVLSEHRGRREAEQRVEELERKLWTEKTESICHNSPGDTTFSRC